MTKVLAFAVVCFACAGAGTKAQAPAPRPVEASPAPREGLLRTCWDAAAQDRAAGAPVAKLEIVDGPLEWRTDQRRLVVRLRLVNSGKTALWFNKRGAFGGSAMGDHEWSIRLKTVVGKAVKSEGDTDWELAKRADYVVVEPNRDFETALKISDAQYMLSAGKYEMSFCFWDQHPDPPAPPNGVVRLDRAIATGPVTVVRTVPPVGAKSTD
jgi:hypothetical protein